MKAIIIDRINPDDAKELVLVSLSIDNEILEGWVLAKPLNYDRKHTTLFQRFKAALKVLSGKSIAVQYFSDLTKEEKIAYAKSQLKPK
jgi:hypothetical protein